MSTWFQEDLPYPGVDLSKLKPKTSDSYPVSLAPFIKNKKFLHKFQEVIENNFTEDLDPSERMFDFLFVKDQYTMNHLLPLFLCKITNPDQSVLIFDEDSKPKRGTRTFGEIAHYVRCIPYQNRDGMSASENAIWCSPEFTMSIKVGTEEDHALLMASIMRTCKHEDQLEFNKFAKEMRKKTVTRKDKDKELLTVDVGTTKTEGDDAETADGTTKDDETKDKTEGKDGEEGKAGETVDDRIFVCLGKTTDGSEKR